MILDEISEKTKIRYEEVKKAVPFDVIKEKALQMNLNTGFPFKKAIAKLRKEEETEIDKDSYFYQIEVIMYDGSISKYPKGFIITDRINSVECEGKLYHTSLYCPKLRAESNDYTLPIKALKILKAHERNINYCFYCEQKLYEELDYERDYMNEYGEEDEE